jgi:sugar-phosphatase
MVISATHQHPMATPHTAIAGYDAVGIAVDNGGWMTLEPQRSAA